MSIYIGGQQYWGQQAMGCFNSYKKRDRKYNQQYFKSLQLSKNKIEITTETFLPQAKGINFDYI